MALDKDYFDAIHIDVVKKKYYNANKVNAVLEDIAAQAQALAAENRVLRAQLSELSQCKNEIGETLLTAQAAARDIIGKAQAQAPSPVAPLVVGGVEHVKEFPLGLAGNARSVVGDLHHHQPVVFPGE